MFQATFLRVHDLIDRRVLQLSPLKVQNWQSRTKQHNAKHPEQYVLSAQKAGSQNGFRLCFRLGHGR